MKTTIAIICLALGFALAILVAGDKPTTSACMEEGIIVVNQHQIQFSGECGGEWTVFCDTIQYSEQGAPLDGVLAGAIDLAMQNP
jgi:hypothetical protein